MFILRSGTGASAENNLSDITEEEELARFKLIKRSLASFSITLRTLYWKEGGCSVAVNCIPLFSASLV